MNRYDHYSTMPVAYGYQDSAEINPFAKPFTMGARHFSMNPYYGRSNEVSMIGGFGNKNDETDSEWLSSPPEYYNVKKANIAPMKNYKYETAYKHNKSTGRVLRYFI
jgi:hypothetical protein